MAKMFDYRVCQVQQSHVTFVNGEWQGHVPLSDAAGATDPFASCPKVWDYLQRVGPDGWELVSAVVRPASANLRGQLAAADGELTAALTHDSYDVLYLQREL